MTLCDYCGKEIESETSGRVGTIITGGNYDINSSPISLPFECHKCGGKYCSIHRLPEAHTCEYNSQSKIGGSTILLEQDKREEISLRIEGIRSQKRQLIDEMNDCVDRGLKDRRTFILDKIHTLDREEEILLKLLKGEIKHESESNEITNEPNYICEYCRKKISQVYTCPNCGKELCSVHASIHDCKSHEPQETPIKSLNFNAIIIIFIVIILSGFIISSFLDNSNSQDSVTPSNSSKDNTEKVTNTIPTPKDAFDKINEYRGQNKKHKILWSDDAYRLAQFRASDMVKRNYYSHTTPDGKTVSDYIGKYNFYSSSAWGENLCKGCSDPYQTWIGSAGDREVLLGGWGKGAVACESDICVFMGVNE